LDCRAFDDIIERNMRLLLTSDSDADLAIDACYYSGTRCHADYGIWRPTILVCSIVSQAQSILPAAALSTRASIPAPMDMAVDNFLDTGSDGAVLFRNWIRLRD
jgi:hypothetical protein